VSESSEKTDIPSISIPFSDREFQQSVKLSNEKLHAFGIHQTMADCILRGYNVMQVEPRPTGYDLVVDKEPRLRLLVRVAAVNQLQVRIGHSAYREDALGNLHTTTTHKRGRNDFDYLAMVDRLTRLVYYVPVHYLDFSKEKYTIRQEDREGFLEF
jgi:hypothetical protein